jgi:hypothetical protein
MYMCVYVISFSLYCGMWYDRRWEDSIKMDLKEIEWEGMHWIQLA